MRPLLLPCLLLGALPGLTVTCQAAPAIRAAAPAMNTNHLIPATPTRTQLALEYIRQHYDPAATSTRITPRMIVIHWTATTSLTATLKAFRAEQLAGRADIRQGGQLNTGAHFLVDREGTIYQLMQETAFARHTIGLNRIAVGIENLGSGQLTPAQLRANTALVQYLAGKYPIEYLIGHFEYGHFRPSALWEEKDPAYFTVKIDPGPAFMKSLREALGKSGLVLKERP